MASWFPCAQLFALPTPTADSFHKNVWIFGFISKQNLNREALKNSPNVSPCPLLPSLPPDHTGDREGGQDIYIYHCGADIWPARHTKSPEPTLRNYRVKKKEDQSNPCNCLSGNPPTAIYLWLTQTWASISVTFNTDLNTELKLSL